jgi:two-component system, NarL family, invasion response regulator UvrY
VSPPAAQLRRTVRVMTVDDQMFFQRATHALIDVIPEFELVGEPMDGYAALALAPTADPDLVLTDIRMPGLDGIEFARLLSAEDPTRVIVLASSAHPTEFAPLARDCGAAALVHKQWLTPRFLRGLWIAHRRR